MQPASVLAARVTVPFETLAQLFATEAVLLSLASERYFSLDDVGTEVWRVLVSAPTVGSAVEQLLGVYDVEKEQLTADVVTFVTELTGAGLVELIHADA